MDKFNDTTGQTGQGNRHHAASILKTKSSESTESVDHVKSTDINPSSDPASLIATAEITAIIQALATTRVASLCKKFCYHNRDQYQCSLDPGWGKTGNEAVLCDWGNATWGWFLEELMNSNRLEKIAGEDSGIITKYFTRIIYSVAFLERFKNWRFQRRIRVPEYIKALDPDAHRIFWFLCDQDEAANIAQRLGRKEQDVRKIIRDINTRLHKRKRSHILNLSKIVSLTSGSAHDGDSTVIDVPVEDKSLDEIQNLTIVKEAWSQLTWLEQYVIDSLVVDGLNAASVLTSLKQQNITVDERIKAEDLNVQHLYYFYRKTLAKLKDISGLDRPPS